MSKNYVHTPTEVEAIQLTPETFEECKSFVGDALTESSEVEYTVTFNGSEGERTARQNDYIIRGVNNILYPCSPEVFEASYTER